MANYPYGNPYMQNPYDNNVPIFAFVNGIEQANSFPIPPNKSAILMDNTKSLFYVKETNPMGQSMIKVYEFKEVSQPQKPQYVTMQDFEAFKQDLISLIKGGASNESDISKQ